MAASAMNSPNLCFGLCTPGVSMKTICFASSVYTQIIRFTRCLGLIGYDSDFVSNRAMSKGGIYQHWGVLQRRQSQI